MLTENKFQHICIKSLKGSTIQGIDEPMAALISVSGEKRKFFFSFLEDVDVAPRPPSGVTSEGVSKQRTEGTPQWEVRVFL